VSNYLPANALRRYNNNPNFVFVYNSTKYIDFIITSGIKRWQAGKIEHPVKYPIKTIFIKIVLMGFFCKAKDLTGSDNCSRYSP